MTYENKYQSRDRPLLLGRGHAIGGWCSHVSHFSLFLIVPFENKSKPCGIACVRIRILHEKGLLRTVKRCVIFFGFATKFIAIPAKVCLISSQVLRFETENILTLFKKRSTYITDTLYSKRESI